MSRLELRHSRPAGYAVHVDNDNDNTTDQREAHLEFMLEEFRAAQQRRRAKQSFALRNRTDAQAALAAQSPAPEKLN